MELKKLECPSCGASMLVEKGRTSFCPYCGNQVVLDDNTIHVEVTSNDTITYRDEARLRELELREQARLREEEVKLREEELREQERLKEEAELEELKRRRKAALPKFWVACGAYFAFLIIGNLLLPEEILKTGSLLLPVIPSLLFPYSAYKAQTALARIFGFCTIYLAILLGSYFVLILAIVGIHGAHS